MKKTKKKKGKKKKKEENNKKAFSKAQTEYQPAKKKKKKKKRKKKRGKKKRKKKKKEKERKKKEKKKKEKRRRKEKKRKGKKRRKEKEKKGKGKKKKKNRGSGKENVFGYVRVTLLHVLKTIAWSRVASSPRTRAIVSTGMSTCNDCGPKCAGWVGCLIHKRDTQCRRNNKRRGLSFPVWEKGSLGDHRPKVASRFNCPLVSEWHVLFQGPSPKAAGALKAPGGTAFRVARDPKNANRHMPGAGGRRAARGRPALTSCGFY